MVQSGSNRDSFLPQAGLAGSSYYEHLEEIRIYFKYMHMIYFIPFLNRRTVRLQEVVVWHSPDVEHMRKKLKFRTYACLAIYTLIIAWVNICYVATFDTPAIIR